MTVDEILRQARDKLQTGGIDSARLDAELLLACVLCQSRTWAIAHQGDRVSPQEVDEFRAFIARRAAREPLAYIVGQKEFYRRVFQVTSAVLIPRPESEDFIDLLRGFQPTQHDAIVDVGCGSGALAITAALEFPEVKALASDISLSALTVAQNNAAQLQANVTFYRSDLLENLTLPSAERIFILANLPYVDKSWPHLSPELDHEPALALYSDADGLAHYLRLFSQISTLAHEVILLVESDQRQISPLHEHALAAGFTTGPARGLISSFAHTPQASPEFPAPAHHAVP